MERVGAPSYFPRPLNLMRPNWTSMVLGPLAQTKGPHRKGTRPRDYHLWYKQRL